MEPFDLLGCEACGAEHAPSCYSPYLESTPSGGDLFGEFHCHECSASYTVAFRASSFVRWFQAERTYQMAQAQVDADRALQVSRSEIGREVATFRRSLELVETVEDMGWT